MSEKAIKTKGKAFFDGLGVVPIPLSHTQIPDCLGRLYQEGLREDYDRDGVCLPRDRKRRGPEPDAVDKQSGHVFLTRDEYWEALCACRNCSVRHPTQ